MNLYQLVHSIPALVSYAAVGNDTAIADYLNNTTIKVQRKITREKVLRWAALTGAITKLEQAKQNGSSQVKGLSSAGLSILSSSVDVLTLDEEFLTFMSTLVSAQVLSESDMSSFLQRAEEDISLAEFHLGRLIDTHEVSLTLLVDRPEGRIPNVQLL